jgi:hypothetical protein
VKALVDAAVMIIAVVVPTLRPQLFPKVLDHSVPQVRSRSGYSDSMSGL